MPRFKVGGTFHRELLQEFDGYTLTPSSSALLKLLTFGVGW